MRRKIMCTTTETYFK